MLIVEALELTLEICNYGEVMVLYDSVVIPVILRLRPRWHALLVYILQNFVFLSLQQLRLIILHCICITAVYSAYVHSLFTGSFIQTVVSYIVTLFKLVMCTTLMAYSI